MACELHQQPSANRPSRDHAPLLSHSQSRPDVVTLNVQMSLRSKLRALDVLVPVLVDPACAGVQASNPLGNAPPVPHHPSLHERSPAGAPPYLIDPVTCTSPAMAPTPRGARSLRTSLWQVSPTTMPTCTSETTETATSSKRSLTGYTPTSSSHPRGSKSRQAI